MSYTLFNLMLHFIFAWYLLIQIVLRRHCLPCLFRTNATGFREQFGSLCRSNGTHCSSITVRWRRWTTEGEKAFVDDRENGKRKREEGERVLSLADVIICWQNRGENMGSGLPETAIMCFFFFFSVYKSSGDAAIPLSCQ